MKATLTIGSCLAIAAALYVQTLHVSENGGSAEASLSEARPAQVAPEAPRAPRVAPTDYTELQQLFKEHGYDQQTLEQGVPEFVVEKLPQNLASVPVVSKKKEIFFLTLMPMILRGNNEILERREFLLEVRDKATKGVELTERERSRFDQLASKYGLLRFGLNLRDIDTLLARADVVPPSLVLAQAANESAWGTSRFALEANNLFGQWTFTPGTGLVPEGRPEGETYEVRLFANLQDSVNSYLHNLNTHPAYRKFRSLRDEMRAQDAPLKGEVLAQGLKNYSIRREAYVREIVSMIRGNDLSRFSSLELRRL